MTPADRSEEHAPARQAPSWLVRLRVRVEAHRLDRRLAAGADPDATPELRRRAAGLLEAGERRRLAAVLDRIDAEAEGARRPFESASPLARDAIRGCAREIQAVVDRLEGNAALDPREVATVAVLIHDQHSPLLDPETTAEELRRALASIAGGSGV